MPSKLVTKSLCAIALFALTASVTLADTWNTNPDEVVLDGYDVVAYRTEDRAVKGLPRYTARYDGVKFHFANQANRDVFLKDPALYAPKYNGYCAFAMGAKGARVPANPDTFKIYNGELLVFFNDMYESQKFNTKIPWNADERGLFSKAEKNWQSLENNP